MIGELGQGGMGIVHLAERSDGQFTRRVALKRVASAAPRVELLRRFRDERQILARLDHPNIARLLDAGLDAGGVPYLVMEHVEGVPVTVYCRQGRLTVRRRLEVFLKVCGAVQHAHQGLVVHRDLKSSNILVTPAGEPKLLDFGVARILDDAPGGGDTVTVNRALTLDAASPEQVRGGAVTTASDVYSLGVLLYELLADTPPYQVGGQSLTEAVRLVCEQVPPPASRVAPPERRGELEGDLDIIVGKATEKAPGDRYASVAALAADVAAYLDHRPVTARRPSFGYLGRKFLRRHRAGALLAAAALALSATGLAMVLWQARVAERERARAQQRFDQVRQLANYLIFDLQDGIGRLGGSTELRRQMVQRSLAYLDELASEASDNTPLQMELAGAYFRLGDVLGQGSAANLGDRPGALASYAKARRLLDQILSGSPADAEARRTLGRLLLNVATTYTEDEADRAARAQEESMAIWQGLVAEDPNQEDNLRGLASAHFGAFIDAQQADRGAGIAHMERALELFQRLLTAKPDDLDRKRNVALCSKYLANYFGDADPPRGHRHTLRAAELDSERLAAEPHNPQVKMDYSFDLSLLGEYHMDQGAYDQALGYYEKALALRRELSQADPANAHARSALAHTMSRVAELQVLAGRPRAAPPLLREAIANVRALPAPESFGTTTMVRSYLYLGEVARAAREDPCPWYRRMAEWQAKADAALITLGPAGSQRRDRAVARLGSCPAVSDTVGPP